jgi:hypothetical protein
MPWRNKYIAPRRHPLALATYGLVFLMGVLFMAGQFHSDVIDALLGTSLWRQVWEWLLAVGGLAGLVGSLWRGDLENGLWLERLGAIAGMFGLLTYASGITIIVGIDAPTWLLLGVLALGCLLRAVQITKEIWRVRRLVSRYMTGESP